MLTSTPETTKPPPLPLCTSGLSESSPYSAAGTGMDFLKRARYKDSQFHCLHGLPLRQPLHISAVHSTKAVIDNDKQTWLYSRETLFTKTDLAHRCAASCSVVISVTHTAGGFTVLPPPELEQQGNSFPLKYHNRYNTSSHICCTSNAFWGKKNIQNLMS